MTRLEMVRIAVRELGETASHDELDSFIRVRFGELIGVKFIPIFRATLRGEEQLRQAREQAARVVAEAQAEAAPGKRKSPPRKRRTGDECPV